MVEIYRNTSKGTDLVKLLPSCGLKGAGIISFFGCNLKCPFCFAQKYSYNDPALEVDLDTKRRMDVDESQLFRDIFEFIDAYPDFCYLQLTGGEPMKTHDQMNETINTLLALDNKGLRVIFQTNGLLVGRTHEKSVEILSRLYELEETHVLFELSLKGTNPSEFQILSGTGKRKLAQYQIDAYWALSNICDKPSNLNRVARLGTGHHHKSISFVYPETGEPMFQRASWSPEFEEVYEDIASRTGYPTMVCETINAEGDGSKWNYLRRSIPALARCAKSNCIQSRIEDSKASQRVGQTYGVDVPANTTLNDSYSEFASLFEPMGKPDHSYCGRNEFPRESRNTCPSECLWIP